MDRRDFFVGVLIVMTIASPSQAGGNGAVVIYVENGQDSTCVEMADHLCLGSFEEKGGESSINAYQRVSYVGVGFDSPASAGGIPLPSLPDESFVFHAEDLYVKSPHGTTFEALSEDTQSRPTAEYFHVNASKETYGARYYWIHFSESSATPSLGPRDAAIAYDPDAVDYDRIGLLNEPQGDDSDNFVRGWRWLVCASRTASGCPQAYDDALVVQRAATPNVRYGLEFYAAEVATDPAMLDFPGDREDHAPSPSISSWVGMVPSIDERRVLPLARPPAEERLKSPSPTPPDSAGRPVALPRPAASDTIDAQPEDEARLPPAALLAASASAAAIGVLAYVLYTRFWRPKDVLQSEARRDLLALVAAEPGLSPSALAKRAKVARNTVVHHLHVLERAQLVRIASEGRELFVFPVAAGPAVAAEGPSLRAARHPVSREVLAILQAHPEGLTRSDLRARMPVVPQRTLNYNVAKLVKAGLVRSEATQGLADVLSLAPVDAERPRAAPCAQRQGSTRGSAT